MKRNTLKQRGRAIIESEAAFARNDATLNGIRPRKGLWLVHPERGKVYGQILKVRRNGVVVWVGEKGVPVKTKPGTLINGGYAYVQHAVMGATYV